MRGFAPVGWRVSLLVPGSSIIRFDSRSISFTRRTVLPGISLFRGIAGWHGVPSEVHRISELNKVFGMHVIIFFVYPVEVVRCSLAKLQPLPLLTTSTTASARHFVMANLDVFDQFSRLPNELKSQVYSYVSQPRRVLQIYYDQELLLWKVCKDALKPDLIAQVHQLSRKNYTIFLDVAILPERDIISICDAKFTLRAIQKSFLSAANVQQLQHLAFTVDVW